MESEVNAPTVLNVVFNFAHFFDGRANDLQEQALSPITNPLEMGSSVGDVLKKLKNLKYDRLFKEAYPEGLNEENLLNAIVEFEKALITPNSRFDGYLRGNENAINEQEKRGYKLFIESGCVSCHNGVNVGGNMYQKFGIFIPYVQDKVSNGRYDVTLRERDRFVYKVPSLRNVALSAPYFHDGSSATLKEAIVDMREHQLGIKGDMNEVDDIEAFLRTLTGETPKILEEAK